MWINLGLKAFWLRRVSFEDCEASKLTPLEICAKIHTCCDEVNY
ncbi:MAG: hypothetical protein UX94_C0006G0017 [Parcubacteria group bacterium GW2011_GWA2_47_21]|nr:MAG: hypothetical protein UX94_C0006G0017 [Parcubacteria group bacterium GW2011_GWA2_47_21]